MCSAARHVVVGTAGHIDHGKSAIVRILTGIEPDRLAEERRRGITIELGFAPLRTDDLVLDIVDVPGHERFLKTMVAGAVGVDLLLLVVAADDGVMVQTREHLDICQLLGVRRGLVAITKVDLVSGERVVAVREQVRQLIAGTFLEQAPVIDCSARTKIGIGELQQALVAAANEANLSSSRRQDGPLKLPIDRVFTIKGFGTVVTGTLASGTIRIGDPLALLPGGRSTAARRLQAHGEAVAQICAGQRAAVNLAGVERSSVHRGDVVTAPGVLACSTLLHVWLETRTCLVRPIEAESRVLFQLGTRQREATCSLLDQQRLGPGEASLAQLRFSQPVVALADESFVLRGFDKRSESGTTLGGGRVIRVLAAPLRRGDRATLSRLHKMRVAAAPARVSLEVEAAGLAGLSPSERRQRVSLGESELAKAVETLVDSQELTRGGVGQCRLIASGLLAHAETALLEQLRLHHRARPHEQGVKAEELQLQLRSQGLDLPLVELLLERLRCSGQLVHERAEWRLPGHQVDHDDPRRVLAERLLTFYQGAGLAPPREAELPELTGGEPAAQIREALSWLRQRKELVRAGKLHFSTQTVAALERRLRDYLVRDGSISPAGFKQLVGQSRKYSIPLAEYFDQTRVTIRVGDCRKLRGR